MKITTLCALVWFLPAIGTAEASKACAGIDAVDVFNAYSRDPWTIQGVKVYMRGVYPMGTAEAMDWPNVMITINGPQCVALTKLSFKDAPMGWIQKIGVERRDGVLYLTPIHDLRR